MIKKKLVSVLLMATLVISTVGCSDKGTSGGNEGSAGSSTEASAETGDSAAGEGSTTDWSSKEFITIDFYDGVANYTGVQPGWLGQIIKDKFNMEVNIIAPNISGGDSLYQTRSAAGNLGDLILASKSQVKDCVDAGIIMDITDFVENKSEYLPTYSVAIEGYKEYLGTDRVYGVPSRSSTLSPTKSQSYGTSPSYGNFMRLDYYKEIGTPELKNDDDVLEALKEMQDLHPTTEDGSKVYAISMFKDWDGVFMKYPITTIQNHGYGAIGECFVLANADATETQTIDQDGGVYYQQLQFFFKANQMGLIDPDSSAQTWDMLVQKVVNGQVLWSMWPWASMSHFNKADKTSEGIGFMHIPVGDHVILAEGYNPYGWDGSCLAIGSECKDPERVMAFLDWLASPEYMELLNVGPRGITWDVVDGKCVLTEYGREVNSNPDAKAPEELGGGTYADGSEKFNTAVGMNADINPNTGESYYKEEWKSTIEEERTKLDEEWTEIFGAFSSMDYLQENNMLEVAPGCDFAAPADSSEIATMRTQCGEVICNTSWNMIYAKDEAEFNALWEQMKEDLRGFGYEEVLSVDYKTIEGFKNARAKAIADAK